jgi:hypothetical protein
MGGGVAGPQGVGESFFPPPCHRERSEQSPHHHERSE